MKSYQKILNVLSITLIQIRKPIKTKLLCFKKKIPLKVILPKDITTFFQAIRFSKLKSVQIQTLQIDKLQQVLAQEQQLHAVSQKTIESKQLQIEDMSRNRSILARIREVFIPSNT